MNRTMTLMFTSFAMVACAPGADSPDAPPPGTVDGDDPAVTDDDPTTGSPDTPDDQTTPPAGPRPLTDDELEALAVAFDSAPFDLDEATEVGPVTVTLTDPGTGVATTSVMDGFAIQTAQGSGGSFYLDFTILVAWEGLDPKAQTVDASLMLYAPTLVDPGSVGLGMVSTYFTDPWAIYTDAAGDETFYSTTGDFDIAAVTLDPATAVDCSDAYVTCTHIEGDLEGDVDFESLGFPGAVFSNDPGMPGGTGAPLDLTATVDVPVSRTTLAPAP